MEVVPDTQAQPKMGFIENHGKKLAIVVSVCILLLCILIPMSFSDVHYYEYGLLKRKSTGKVDISKVYTSGRYLVGPDYTFKAFKADAHFVKLANFAVFTSDKLEVRISCAFQYFLKPEDLGELHKEYDLFYKPVIESTGVSAIKGKAAMLPINEYIRDREKVERILFETVATRLGGTCCRANCGQTSSCKAGCKPLSTCSRSDKGLFVDVASFQLLTVIIPNDVKARYLSQVIESANEEKESFIQKEKIVKKETEKLIKDIDNEAAVILQNATAQATLAKGRATATALLKVESARNSGLTTIYKRLGITSEQHKASFNYLRALRKRGDVTLNVDYTTLMARGN